ncbi:MAG: hypothetical protein ACK5AL_05325 [Planctomycetota bacterium]|jgi:hypothetical protein
MKSGIARQDLLRLLNAYLGSIAFGVSFVAASLLGVDGLTALGRSVLALGLALVAGQFLAPPVVDVVLQAIARDEAKRLADQEKVRR